ncbi:acyltransferase, partial [Nocardiopsis sp. NPDC006832]
WQFVVLYLWRDFTGQEIFAGSFWLDIIPVLIFTTLLAKLTFHFVEEPSRKWSRRFLSEGRRGRRPVPAGPPPR